MDLKKIRMGVVVCLMAVLASSCTGGTVTIREKDARTEVYEVELVDVSVAAQVVACFLQNGKLYLCEEYQWGGRVYAKDALNGYNTWAFEKESAILSDREAAYCVLPVSDGGFLLYLLGMDGACYLRKYDASWNVVSEVRMKGTGNVVEMVEDEDGGFFITPTSDDREIEYFNANLERMESIHYPGTKPVGLGKTREGKIYAIQETERQDLVSYYVLDKEKGKLVKKYDIKTTAATTGQSSGEGTYYHKGGSLIYRNGDGELVVYDVEGKELRKWTYAVNGTYVDVSWNAGCEIGDGQYVVAGTVAGDGQYRTYALKRRQDAS